VWYLKINGFFFQNIGVYGDNWEYFFRKWIKKNKFWGNLQKLIDSGRRNRTIYR